MVALSVPRNDYPSTWSGPEGSSHSGNIVCRVWLAGPPPFRKSLILKDFFS